MKDKNRTKEQLILELAAMHQRVAEIDKIEHERKQAEKEYQTIIRTAIDGFWIADMQGHFLDVNDAYCRLIGYSRDEMLKMKIPDIEATEKPEETAQRIQKIRETGGARFETRHRRKDSRIVDIEVSVNYRKEIDRMFVFLRDITERKQIEDALRESEKRYKEVVESATELIHTTDLRGNFTFANSAALKIVGYSLEEIKRLNYLDLILPEHRQRLSEIYINQFREKEPTIYVEFPFLSKAGEIIWWGQNSSLMFEGGKVVGFHSVARDITELKRAEETLRRSEEEAKRLAQENMVMAEIGRIISSTLNIEEVYERFVEEARKLIQGGRVTIAIANPDGNTCTVAYAWGLEVDGRKAGDVFPLAGSTSEKAMRTRSSILTQEEDIEGALKLFPTLSRYYKSGLQSMIVVPLISKNNVIGVLHFRSSKPKAYTQSDVIIAERVGNQIAGAIDNAGLFAQRKRAEDALRKSEEQTKRLAQENKLVAEIGRIINSSPNIDEVFERFSKEVAKLIPFDRIVVNLNSPQKDTTFVRYVAGIDVSNRRPGEYVPLAGTATAECMRTKSSLLIQPEEIRDIEGVLGRFPKLLSNFESGIRSIIMVPLIAEDQIIGVLSLRSVKTKAYADQDVTLAKSIASQIAGAVANAQLYIERLQAEEAARRSAEEAKRLAKENAVMAEIGQIISSTLDIEKIYERFAEEVRTLIPFDRISVNAVNNIEDRTFTILYVSGIQVGNRIAGTVIPLAGSGTEEVMRIRVSVLMREENREEILKRCPGLLPVFQAGHRSVMMVPMISKNETIGAFNIESARPNAYSERDLRLAERIANQIAGAIANAQLFTERKQAEEALRGSEGAAQRLAQENAFVAEIGRIINSTLNIDEVFERFSKAVPKLIPFDRIAVNLISPQKDASFVRYVTGIDVPSRRAGEYVSLVLGSATEECVRTKSSLLIQPKDIKEREEVLGRFPKLLPTFESGIRSIIMIPLIGENQVKGVLSLRSTKTKAYTDQDVRLAESIASQIAGAVANAQLYEERVRAEAAARRSEEEARRLAKEAVTLADIGRIISSTLNIEEVYERFTEELHKLIPTDRTTFNIINPDNSTITNVYTWGIEIASRRPGESYPLAGSASEKVMQTKSGLIIKMEDENEIASWVPSLLPGFRAGIRSLMAIPLISRDQVIGVLHLQSIKPNAYTEEDLKIAERVGNQIAGAVDNAQLFAERKRAEKEREKLIHELQDALANIKILRGMLPICSSCKKIRDDKGYWNQIESYIRDHTEAEFTHGICPECIKKLYPDLEFIKANP